MNAWLRRGIKDRVYVYNNKRSCKVKSKRKQSMFTISVEDLPADLEIKYGEVIGVKLEVDTSMDSKMKASLWSLRDNEDKRVFVFINEVYLGNGTWHGNLAYTIPLQDVPSDLDVKHAKCPVEVGLKIIK